MSFVFGEHFVAEILLKGFADNEDDFAKACLNGIIDGIIHDGLTIGTQTVKLFQTSIAATHTGSEEQ